MSSELVTLLRQQSKIGPINVPRAAMRDAAARIEALEAENARLREALEPFSEACKQVDRGGPDNAGFIGAGLTLGDLRAARRAREGGNNA